MGSRLLPLSLALAALVAEAGGLPGLALYLGLVAVAPAAAAAFVAISDALEGRAAGLRACSNGLALLLVVVASAVREGAPKGGPVPALATYALVGALLVYLIPAVAWLLEPLRPSRAHARAEIRASAS